MQKEIPKIGKRAAKATSTRQALFRSAEQVVGEHGYLRALISMITFRAKVAAGTFYNYFDSRQDLFDKLLPWSGREMLDFIKARAEISPNETEREELRFRAYFDFLNQRPEFYRILYEAEVFAPTAFNEHVENVANNYIRVLKRARDTGELNDFEPSEIEYLAYMLLGARYYISMRYGDRFRGDQKLLDSAVRTYMKLVTGGLFTRDPAVGVTPDSKG